MISVEVVAGPLEGKRFEVEQLPAILGRGATCDVRLDDPLVSRTHCLIDRVGKLLYVKDLDSHNGIFVDSVRAAQTFLHSGSRLRLGASVLRVRLRHPEGEAGEAAAGAFGQGRLGDGAAGEEEPRRDSPTDSQDW